MKIDSLDGIKKITFYDYSEYFPELCNDGGAYGFFTIYMRISNDEWKISYKTTADFDYCPVCGCFADHYKGDNCDYNSGYKCGEFDTIKTNELLNLINNFSETDFKYFEIEN